jgi:hypothetical protein
LTIITIGIDNKNSTREPAKSQPVNLTSGRASLLPRFAKIRRRTDHKTQEQPRKLKKNHSEIWSLLGKYKNIVVTIEKINATRAKVLTDAMSAAIIVLRNNDFPYRDVEGGLTNGKTNNACVPTIIAEVTREKLQYIFTVEPSIHQNNAKDPITNATHKTYAPKIINNRFLQFM